MFEIGRWILLRQVLILYNCETNDQNVSAKKKYLQLNLRHRLKAMLARSVWKSDKIADFTMMSENIHPFDLDCK